MKIVLDYSSLKTSHCPLVIKHCLLENTLFSSMILLEASVFEHGFLSHGHDDTGVSLSISHSSI